MVRRRTISPTQPLQLKARDDRDQRTRIHTTEKPTWTDVKSAIERLDNTSFTSVILRGVLGRTLEVAGGREERVLCYVAYADEEAGNTTETRYLVDLARDPAIFEQSSGGQPSALPGIASVDRALALKAARYFFDKHTEDPALVWQAL